MFRRKGRSKSVPTLAKLPSGKQLSRSYGSMPSIVPRVFLKSILKFKSVDESLHSNYGEHKEEERPPKNIAFKDIMIREYSRTIGDNPSCSSGPPISISWDYNPDTIVLPVEQYEELRPPRRANVEMVLPREIRFKLLKQEWGISQSQIAAAVRANVKIKNQRRATFNNLDKATKMEEMMESVGKKLVRGFTMKKSTKKELEQLEAQIEEVNRARVRHQIERMEPATEDLATDGMDYEDDLSAEEDIGDSKVDDDDLDAPLPKVDLDDIPDPPRKLDLPAPPPPKFDEEDVLSV